MFESAARQMGVAIEEMVHVGDRDHNDVKGPQKLGMKAILFVAHPRRRHGPRPAPTRSASATPICRERSTGWRADPGHSGWDSPLPPASRPCAIAISRAILAANFLATMALAMQAVALGWQIYDLTGSPFKLGLVGLMEFLPPFCLALVTGHIADRFDRRRIVALGLLAEAVAALSLVLMILLHRVSVFGILSVAFAFGIGARLFHPGPAGDDAEPDAGRAFPQRGCLVVHFLAGRNHRRPGAGRPALCPGPRGGLWRDRDGAAGGGAVDPGDHAAPADGDDRAAGPGIAPGRGRLIFRHKLLLGAISLDLFAVLFSGAAALLPVYAKDILHVGPAGLGVLRSAPGLGAVATAVLLTQWPLEAPCRARGCSWPSAFSA